MITDFWINLPVKNVSLSVTFFTKLGFSFNTQHGNNDHSASLIIGKQKVVVMLFDESSFKNFTSAEISDTKKATEILISVGVESKEEVDELADKAIAAGGSSNHKPTEIKDWMYGCVFNDIDGHKWNVLYMDMSKMK